ncbi:MAG TPA: tripartite tricarboxylate transporter substrate-binding protein [candidate division Zixibacteria bacterium]|nr:tripartite tricarboxylate transporter substrate-binding protein [candidate division Zixibacteria bacterium]
MKRRLTAVVAVFLSLSLSTPLFGDDFYKGKTIRAIVGGTAGGGFDVYTRAVTRYMGKHIPGNPTFVVENMTGAATRIAAKYIHGAAKPDGLTFGIFNGYLILSQVLNPKAFDFDVRKFEWIGVPVQDNVACALRRESGITRVDQWLAARAPIKMGGLGPGNSTSDVVRTIKATLNLPVQLVEGYKGTADIRLAADGGELQGACWAYESIKVTWTKALQAGDVNVVLQVTEKKIPELSSVPSALELAKTDEAREIIRHGAIAPSAITRVYVTTPGTPRDRVQILRKAFADTLKDPDFLAEAKKARLEVNPLGGEEVGRIVADLFSLSPAMVSRLAAILAAK